MSEVLEEREPHDGFTVEDTVIPQEWVDFGFEDHSEYIHLIPDPEENELRCYRSIDEPGEGNRRLKTVIKDVYFSYNWDEEEGEVNGFYLTWHQAMTFMSFIDLMGRGREGHINLNWWEDSGKKMHEDIRTKEENLILKYTKPNGVERLVQIASTWQTPTHKMANIEGEGFGQ